MNKGRIREIRQLVTGAALELVSVDITGSNHYKARVRTETGSEGNFIFSSSPSDCRGDKNKLSLLRRFARGEHRITRSAA